jgi:hypothetical protein
MPTTKLRRGIGRPRLLPMRVISVGNELIRRGVNGTPVPLKPKRG